MELRRSKALGILLLFAAFSAAALEVPPAPTQWVTDRANLLSPGDAAALNQKLAAFEQETGAQFIIYTIPSLEGDAVESFTIRAVDQWRVGQDKYDNGLVLFVFRDEKKIRVETGYGLEGSITDAFASRVIREVIAPRFAEGQWAAGLDAGAEALMAQIRSGEAPVEPMRRGRGGENPPSVPSVLFMLFIFAMIFFVLPMLGRRRGCAGCWLPLMFLPTGRGVTFGGHRGGFGGFGGGGGGFGGFSGGGGGFGGGGATGGW